MQFRFSVLQGPPHRPVQEPPPLYGSGFSQRIRTLGFVTGGDSVELQELVQQSLEVLSSLMLELEAGRADSWERKIDTR